MKRDEFNASEVLPQLNNNTTLLNKLLVSFLETIPGDISTMQIAVEAGDKERLAKVAHKIKPSVSILIGGSLLAVLKELEINKGKSDLELKKVMSVFQNEVSLLTNEIRTYLSQN